jgi:DNA-binding NarL/FixJ family response regulator
MISVLVIDDHPIVCDGLARMLAAEDDIDVIGTGHDGDVAITMDADLRPDIVLMDLSMRNIDGIEATRRIVNSRDGAKVLILAGTVDTNRVLAAIDAGAVGFLIKDNDPTAIADGIRAAARGESPLDPRIARALVTDRYGRRAGVNLTERELEVLQMAANGMLNKQIGRALGIGEKTVKAHLGRIYDRLGVTNRTDAVAWALSAELVTPAPLGQTNYDGSYDGENLTATAEERPRDLVE